MKSKLIVPCSIVILLLAAAFTGKRSHMININAKARVSDTAAFTANTSGGWSFLSVYLNQDTPDSVEFEVTLKQSASVNWHERQSIGSISNAAFYPQTNQRITYKLLANSQWLVEINTDGHCYLSQVTGAPLPASAMTGQPYILPVKLRYKNN